jgi:hypothetical protein
MAPQPPPTKSGWSRRTVTEDTLEDELEQVDHDETTLVSAAAANAKEQRLLREACPQATVDECARFAGWWSKDWEQARANQQLLP